MQRIADELATDPEALGINEVKRSCNIRNLTDWINPREFGLSNFGSRAREPRSVLFPSYRASWSR